MAGWRHRREGPLRGWCGTIPGSRSSGVRRGSRSSRASASTSAGTCWTTHAWPRTRCSARWRSARCRRSRAARPSAPAPCSPCCRSAGCWSRSARCCRSSTAAAAGGHVRARLRRQLTSASAARGSSASPPAPSCCTSCRASRRIDPGSLGCRLAGLTLAVLLLAGGRAGALAGPDAGAVHHEARRRRRPRSPGCLDAVADGWSGRPRRPRPARPRCCRGATDAAEALRPSRLPPGSGRPRPGGATGRSPPRPAPPGCCSAARSTCPLIDDHRRRHAARRPPRCCARRRRAPRPRRPGCAGDGHPRCPTPTGSRPRWTSSAPPGRPSRPTASRPTGCGWARSR